MGLIVSLLIGALVGWLASTLMKTDAQMGAVSNIAVGIVGAWIGRLIAGLLGLAATSMLGSILISIAGACALIAILKAGGVLK